MLETVKMRQESETLQASGLSGNLAGSEGIPIPVMPRTLQETGLPFSFLVDLILKVLYRTGQLSLWHVAERICLPLSLIEPLLQFMRSEQLCEVPRRGNAEADISYQLTDLGRQRAEAAQRKSQYCGPAPVTLADYTAQVERQSLAGFRITRPMMTSAFAGVVIRDELLAQFGAALNSGRAVLIHGPSGSGKTYVAEHLAQAIPGQVYVPHALLVDGEVIQVFDPLVHFRIEVTPAGHAGNGLARRAEHDQRWLLCQRPVVLTGGELTLPMLDMQFDSHTRFYVAPPQVKANNGLFIIDDLGRQLVSPRDLMNRWIVPLDRRVDHYALHTGLRFQLPFDVSVIFSTNLHPADLGDGAFLRRMGYKIRVGEISGEEYGAILQQACQRAQVPFSEAALDYLVQRHAAEHRPLLANIPFDLVSKLRDAARYAGQLPEMTESGLDQAWENYFSGS